MNVIKKLNPVGKSMPPPNNFDVKEYVNRTRRDAGLATTAEAFDGSDSPLVGDISPLFHAYASTKRFEALFDTYEFTDFAQVLHWYNQLPLEKRLSTNQLEIIRGLVVKPDLITAQLRIPTYREVLDEWFGIFNDAFFFGALEKKPFKILTEKPWPPKCKQLEDKANSTPTSSNKKHLSTVITINVHHFVPVHGHDRPQEHCQDILIMLLHEMLHEFMSVFGRTSKNNRSHGPEFANCMVLLLKAQWNMVERSLDSEGRTTKLIPKDLPKYKQLPKKTLLGLWRITILENAGRKNMCSRKRYLKAEDDEGKDGEHEDDKDVDEVDENDANPGFYHDTWESESESDETNN
ncbi:hypothetical protein GLAREA_08029 [Glarea lozoyensis ATCC 20868]|uniref:SprT-like domain-containing protein n=1 Tax=Glarea lozoyensis (strain ATCC 20868 / MF5171) TaxID=1116229 RepID=S3CFZ2_GLAL2|nr:uncharacterized protein GLAREA_08029 [Glarea lozoyensis ATCC 20868]EPE24179.1 hypothetical protein GLAREA_08029 [Glarea lozoyensis ATCC 20868]